MGCLKRTCLQLATGCGWPPVRGATNPAACLLPRLHGATLSSRPQRSETPPSLRVFVTALFATPFLSSSPLFASRADLEWRVTYVGSASSAEYDQELENVLVGPVPIGISKFVLSVSMQWGDGPGLQGKMGATAPRGGASSACRTPPLPHDATSLLPSPLAPLLLQTNPPDPSKIPEDDLLGATVVMLNCAYKGKEFIRVGYWISNTYADEVEGVEPPKPCPPNMIVRNILADKPRVTRFAIDWS